MKKLGIILVILPCLLASSVFAAWNFNAETSLKDSDSKTIDVETQFKDIYAISYNGVTNTTSLPHHAFANTVAEIE